MKNKVYEHVISEIEDWPIHKLHRNREEFVEELKQFTLKHLLELPPGQLSKIIQKTIYLERIRVKEEPWKVDPPNERLFWRRMRKKMLHGALDKEEQEARIIYEEILDLIVGRYSKEIVGSFSKKTFLFARRFLTFFFNRLLNTAASRNLRRFYNTKYHLYDRLPVRGETEITRNLMKKGILLVLPTHFSNLDSILIGYAMDSVVGLPSFSYGAGLNLYNTGYTAYFMNRLGAYRVDRRKKNPVYLENLKAMSNLSLQKGTNSIFFPGGTRARSGSLETRLKLGLLSTALDAQRALYQKGDDRKIFVVPLVLCYHFVLEAKFLMRQHLIRTGKEKFVASRDEFMSLRTIIKFLWEVFSSSNDIILSFGKPMDVLGNQVDKEGNSYDKYGKLIDVKEYFMSNGKVLEDKQRESEYTKRLAEKVVERYYKDNIVLSSHLLAFAAFNLLRHQNAQLDLYGLLRLPEEDYIFPKDVLCKVLKQLQAHLIEMEKEDNVKLSEPIFWESEKLLQEGIRRLGTYHSERPLLIDKEGQVVSQSFLILYYYHNRLENYGLDKIIQWEHYEMEVE